MATLEETIAELIVKNGFAPVLQAIDDYCTDVISGDAELHEADGLEDAELVSEAITELLPELD